MTTIDDGIRILPPSVRANSIARTVSLIQQYLTVAALDPDDPSSIDDVRYLARQARDEINGLCRMIEADKDKRPLP